MARQTNAQSGKTNVGRGVIGLLLEDHPNMPANRIITALRNQNLTYASRQTMLADVRAAKGIEKRANVDAQRKGGQRSGSTRAARSTNPKVRAEGAAREAGRKMRQNDAARGGTLAGTVPVRARKGDTLGVMEGIALEDAAMGQTILFVAKE